MLQLIINSFTSGILIAMVALGFGIIFSTTKIFHLAHGGIYVSGVYFFYWLFLVVGIGFVYSLIGALLFTIILAVFIEWLVYKPLLKRATNPNIVLISSLGVFIILVNILALIAGNDIKIFSSTLAKSIVISNVIITKNQLNNVIVGLPIIILFNYLINRTELGIKIKAVSNNLTLARVVGIRLQNIRYLVFILGSLMAVGAGLLKAFDTGIDPYSGLNITFTAIVATILGGSNSLKGTIYASFILAFIQNISEYFLSSQWRDPVTFFILMVVLLWRTEGILKYKIRLDEK